MWKQFPTALSQVDLQDSSSSNLIAIFSILSILGILLNLYLIWSLHDMTLQIF
jgi:hypothetical protein